MKTEPILDSCPECGETKKSRLSNTAIWFECKTCGYAEDSFKGPITTLDRRPNSTVPFTQYL
jgi:ribosomal protein L37AE/L43A